ncbi:MAG: prepilin-type N-terminal cleavage/methylation domain-containing protein [Kiritimatiellales bacterium]|nr:prepilin-type N-terminal cleavage/methylation domain-containing protein [Kiritimatiellales bacterium]
MNGLPTTKRIDSDHCVDTKSKKCAGSTFIEALVAMSIFAIFITGACQLLVSHRKIMDMARDHYTAANIAKNRLELVRTFDFDQIPQLTESAIVVNDAGIASTQGHFRRSTTVNTLNTNLYELAITVKIKDRKTLVFNETGETISTYVAMHL